MTGVLVARLSAMGDLVHGLGVIEALAAARPDLDLHVVTQRDLAPLLEQLDYVCSVVPHDRRPALRGLLAGARRTRRLGCTVALDLQGNWKSALVCALSGARERIGVRGSLRWERTSGLLINRGVTAARPGHPTALALAVARRLAPDLAPGPPRLRATTAEVEREARELRRLGLDPEAPFRVLVASDDGDPRGLRRAALEREAARPGPPVLVLVGPAEAAVALTPRLPQLRHAAGELRRLVGLGVVMARAGALAIGPDRGAQHVLAACGVETVTLFGPQDPAWTAPVGSRIAVRADGPACVPCRARACRHPEGPVCMDFDTGTARVLGRVDPSGRLGSS